MNVRSKKQPDKTQSQMKHAIRRAHERFDVTIFPHHLFEMVRKIQQGEVGFVRKQSHRISVWEVELPDGIMAQAIYDNQRKMIVTFLPLDWPPLWDPERENASFEDL